MSNRLRLVIGSLLAALLFAGGVAMLHTGIYGLTLFILSPAIVGGLATWALRPGTGRLAARNGALAAGGSACLLFLMGMEGAICVAMVLPLAMPLGALGGWLAYLGMNTHLPERGLTLLLLLPAISLMWDVKAPAQWFAVESKVEIAAPPERVWQYVAAFPELPEAHEWYFRAGVAYPKRAWLSGSGTGATRYCEFSTGSVVEPIEVWDPPRLLRFRVTATPAPMTEWSIYGPILPKHLHGYLISRQGEFRLTRLPSGGTLLEGTSRYQHGLWPAEYWRWWSDAIIHRIHLRVLRHIRMLAEQDNSRSW